MYFQTQPSLPRNDHCDDCPVVQGVLVNLAQNKYVLSAFYFFLMVQIFVAIAMIADIFMQSIEFITSQCKSTKRYNVQKKCYEIVRQPLWNKTVANLSLMALGSSAPEIFLSTIQLGINKFEAEKLGPGTIVGASMFNTLVITAFCVIVIPQNQSKRIKNIKVFWVSTFFSVMAYVWLYFILNVFSPNRVTISEASITFLMFPAMVMCGYIADHDWFSKIEKSSEYEQFDNPCENSQHCNEQFSQLNKEILAIEPKLTGRECDQIVQYLCHKSNHNSILENKTKEIHKLYENSAKPILNGKLQAIYNQLEAQLVCDETSDATNTGLAEENIVNDRSIWVDQIKVAFKVDNDSTWWNLITYLFTFYWKVMFACIPPTHVLNGWATFFGSIAMIAVLTATMGWLANSFGCHLELDLHATAITVVAIGTSLPDLFASRVAAIHEEYADCAIGNINGSNAFNVFLGLGFPWLCASIYHYCNGSDFVVTDLTDLAFSVQLFVIFSAMHITLLTMRRKGSIFGYGELGGPNKFKFYTFAFLIGLWLLYILLSLVH